MKTFLLFALLGVAVANHVPGHVGEDHIILLHGGSDVHPVARWTPVLASPEPVLLSRSAVPQLSDNAEEWHLVHHLSHDEPELHAVRAHGIQQDIVLDRLRKGCCLICICVHGHGKPPTVG